MSRDHSRFGLCNVLLPLGFEPGWNGCSVKSVWQGKAAGLGDRACLGRPGVPGPAGAGNLKLAGETVKPDFQGEREARKVRKRKTRTWGWRTTCAGDTVEKGTRSK